MRETRANELGEKRLYDFSEGTEGTCCRHIYKATL